MKKSEEINIKGDVFMKKSIDKFNACLNQSGIFPIMVVEVVESPNTFAVFTTTGFDLYTFKNGSANKLSEDKWEDWNNATVDHFFTYSLFTFTGDNRSKELKVNLKGKEVANIIKNNTSISLEEIPRKWWNKILGFRSKTKWKMIVATIVYLLIIGWIGNGMTDKPAPANAPTVTTSTAKTPEQIAQDKANADAKAKQEADAKAAKEKADAEAKAAAAAKALETLKSEAQTIPYKDLARNPDTYKGKSVKYTGEVIQVQEDSGLVGLRVNVTKSSYGYEDTVFVAYDKNIISSRVLEKDIITFYGTSAGLLTYKTVMGSEMTIPQIAAKIVQIN